MPCVPDNQQTQRIIACLTLPIQHARCMKSCLRMAEQGHGGHSHTVHAVMAAHTRAHMQTHKQAHTHSCAWLSRAMGDIVEEMDTHRRKSLALLARKGTDGRCELDEGEPPPAPPRASRSFSKVALLLQTWQ